MNERELRLRVRDLEKLARRNAELEQKDADLRTTIAEQSRCIADQQRQIVELRGAVDALLQPAASELLSANFTERDRRKTSDP
jgi:peptidoglycan hydrolase CwlO-like protein